MKQVIGKVFKVVLATVVATQGAWLMPAFAAGGSKRLAVKEVSAQELKLEYGAGGGGGGSTNPPPSSPPVAPNNCTWDYDNDYKCDTPDISSVTQGNYDSEKFETASTRVECKTVSDVSEPGYCTGSFSVSNSITVTATFSGEFGPVTAGVEVSGPQTYFITVNPDYRVALGYWARLEIYSKYNVTYGYYNRYFKDADVATQPSTYVISRIGTWTYEKPTGWVPRTVIGRL
jgi:hypothetical protein